MTIIGFCNPLLDISISNLSGISKLLQKYELKDNDVILADPLKHSDLIEDMKRLAEDEHGVVEYTAGGAGLNSLRCAQLLMKDHTCRIVGSIGNDLYGQILTEKATEVGLLTCFQESSPKPTGKCACLIHGPFRSLVAYLDAANDFRPEHLDTVSREISEEADWIYITGFFYAVSPESTRRIINLKKMREQTKIVFNLSATFVCDLITEDDFNLIMDNSFILIGNCQEFKHLKQKLKRSGESDEEFGLEMIGKYSNLLVIITNGSDPILLISGSQGIRKHPVPPVHEIVDTNGAGDAFVGGLLGGLHSNFSIEEAVEVACFMAASVIKKSGIEPPTPQELAMYLNKK